MAGPVEFFFDFSSPYGFLASLRIDDIAARHGREAAWKPILLGAVFKVSGQQPLVEIPLKGEYARHDLARFARLWGTDLRFPPLFPFSSVAASRAFYWIAASDRALATRFARAAFSAAWREERDISRSDTVADIAAAVGADRDDALAALLDPAVKELLRVEVEAAIARGIFGSPFVVVDGEGFWGADRLWQVEAWLERGGW
ncbi:MAG: 2-hydroxychromene-2-carboxylate isomerase [Alphaproteobacteria bacterium]|nr:2-hydroxychromene-2-carboxylate isomerase [Alphaproteobacteria bacterium]MBM3626585.1 2-hydroxychromene-2-carboxylate isomerase [Alphaproteobacteria bacterium]